MATQKYLTYTILDSDEKLSASTCELTLNVLATTGNYLVHKDLLRHSVGRKQGTFSTKTRSEVRGGGRKPWQQKGTGRARAGSNRSPLWKGGGVIFGPKPKIQVLKLNKKERRLSLQTLLYNKKNSILVVGKLESSLLEAKTQNFVTVCNGYQLNLNQRILIVVSKKTRPLKLSVQNLRNIELIAADNLNTFSLLKADQIILTRPAIKIIKEIYCE